MNPTHCPPSCRVIAITLLILFAGNCPAADAKIPVILDTELGSRPDDAFALALLLASPEVEIRGVTTVGRDAQDRAAIACRFVTHADRRQIPIAAGGVPQSGRGDPIDWQIQYRRHPAVVWDRTAKPRKESAVEFLHQQLKSDPGKLTLIATGPLTNIARLIRDHPECKPWMKRIIFSAKSAVAADPDAAKVLLQSGIPLTVIPAQIVEDFVASQAMRQKLFAACTPLTFQLQALCELSDQSASNLSEAAAVALAFTDEFCKFAELALTINDENDIAPAAGEKPNARVVTTISTARFSPWYADRVAAGRPVLPKPPPNPSRPVDRGNFPARVHVVEDYETDIEKRWWLAGKLETQDVPPGTGSRRACRAVLTQDFDDRMGDHRTCYRAVVFNPVPGPPVGANTRLNFRYKLTGDGTLRIQLFSLSNGYHRCLSLHDLPQGKWADATVDVTQMRRPDGSGGPLSRDERIDDIQFYVDPRADLVIDDIVLYDDSLPGETLPFPRRILFTGWFDTGRQGQGHEWPGHFEIARHEPPLTWKAAKSVNDPRTGNPWLRIHLRGLRPIPDTTHLSFRYRYAGDKDIRATLADTKGDKRLDRDFSPPAEGMWSHTTLTFDPKGSPSQADEIRFHLAPGATLFVDDVLLFEPAGDR